MTFFPVTSPVSKTIAFLRVHYAICKYMVTVRFQCNFRKTAARFSAGRRYRLVASDMLLFWCSSFKYRLIKLDSAKLESFALILVVSLVA